MNVSESITLTVDSDLNGASPQFILTCISTGVPATTVTWTRDSEMLTGSTVLNDATTAQYTHTLTVTGRLGGLYTCTVSNNKPSSMSSTYPVEGTCISYYCTHSNYLNGQQDTISTEGATFSLKYSLSPSQVEKKICMTIDLQQMERRKEDWTISSHDACSMCHVKSLTISCFFKESPQPLCSMDYSHNNLHDV